MHKTDTEGEKKSKIRKIPNFITVSSFGFVFFFPRVTSKINSNYLPFTIKSSLERTIILEIIKKESSNIFYEHIFVGAEDWTEWRHSLISHCDENLKEVDELWKKSQSIKSNARTINYTRAD